MYIDECKVLGASYLRETSSVRIWTVIYKSLLSLVTHQDVLY